MKLIVLTKMKSDPLFLKFTQQSCSDLNNLQVTKIHISYIVSLWNLKTCETMPNTFQMQNVHILFLVSTI